MGRSVTWICVTVTSTLAGLVPTIWGASALSAQAILFGAAGAVAGVWLAARLSERL
jgi:hypothetical protein